VSAPQGGSAVANVSSIVSAPFSNSIQLSVSGQPAGVTATLNPTLFAPPGAGKSVLSLAVAPGTTPGIYTLTISGAGGGSTQQTTLTLTINPAADFNITASQTSVSVVKGSTATTTITTAKNGTFSSAIALSTSGVASYLTAGLSPTSV